MEEKKDFKTVSDIRKDAEVTSIPEETLSVTPVGPYILVTPEKEEEKKTASGIVLTGDDVKSKNKYGVVSKLGNGVLLSSGVRSTFNVREGDRILYKDFAGYTVTHNDIDYLLLVESDILAVVQ